MKGQLKANSPAEYLAQLEEPRRADVAALDALIRKTAPQLKPFVQMGILAYGRCQLKYAGGREADWFRVGVASNKSYISLYICGADEQGPIAERYKAELPKANIGRGCVRFKRLSDLDQSALRRLIGDVARLADKA